MSSASADSRACSAHQQTSVYKKKTLKKKMLTHVPARHQGDDQQTSVYKKKNIEKKTLKK